MSSINPVSSAGSVPLITPPAPEVQDTSGTDSSFSNMIGDAVQGLDNTLNKADTLTMQAATGQLTDVHDLTIATNEATLATEFTVAVRNKALEAFDEIMRMPI